MTNTSVKFKKFCSFPLARLVSLEASLEAERKKGFFRQSHWRFSRKAKCLVAVAIVAVMLVSVFAFLPKQSVSRDVVVPQSRKIRRRRRRRLLRQIKVICPRFQVQLHRLIKWV